MEGNIKNKHALFTKSPVIYNSTHTPEDTIIHLIGKLSMTYQGPRL